MKNVIIILMTLVMNQACQQLAGMDDASKQLAGEKQCSVANGCPWYLDEKELKYEGCMQDYVQEFIDDGYDCQLLSEDNQISCLYPNDMTQEEIDNVVSVKAQALRDKVNAQFGWYDIGTKPAVRVSIYYTKSLTNNGGSSVNGVFTPNPAHVAVNISDYSTITMEDCSN